MQSDLRHEQRWRVGKVVFAVLLILTAGCSGAAPAGPTSSPIPIVNPTETMTASPVPPSATATQAPPTVTATLPASPTAVSRATRTATARPSSTATEAASPTNAAAMTPAATALPATPGQAAGDFTPTAVSVWNTAIIGGDYTSGPCSGTLTPVYGLVQITPNGDRLSWKNQEPAPYTFDRVGPNVWQYSGPTAIGDGTLTMVVTFTSATTFEMTRTFAPSAEAGCTHMHYYSGTWQWNS